MNEQPLDLRRIVQALLRRWLLILVLVWTGCFAGFLVASRQQPVYVAVSTVLLPPAPAGTDGKPSRNVLTEVNIASNGNILGSAGRAVEPALDALAMRKRIKVEALTTDILEVRAEAPSAADAALLADAVAREYVAEVTSASSRLSGTAISGLEAQAAKVEARLQQTKAEIDEMTIEVSRLPPTSAERTRQAAILDELDLQVRESARQLASLADRIADARLQDQLNRDGTKLLAPAIAPTEPSNPKPLVLTLFGALLGFASAVVLSLILDRRDGRIRRRSEIAAVVAAPVLASLETPRRLSARQCRLMVERWHPQPLESWVLRQSCMRLGLLPGDPPSELVVVGLPDDTAGPVVALQLAVFAASAGIATAFIVATPHPTCARMRSACHQDAKRGEVRPHLRTYSHRTRADEIDGRAQLTVTVVIADSDSNFAELTNLPANAVTTLAVSSGFATPDDLATAALSCLDAGRPLAGVFLANPDPSDPTTGDPVGLSRLPLRREEWMFDGSEVGDGEHGGQLRNGLDPQGAVALEGGGHTVDGEYDGPNGAAIGGQELGHSTGAVDDSRDSKRSAGPLRGGNGKINGSRAYGGDSTDLTSGNDQV